MKHARLLILSALSFVAFGVGGCATPPTSDGFEPFHTPHKITIPIAPPAAR